MQPTGLVLPLLAALATSASAVPGAAGAWENTGLPGYASVRAFASAPAGLLAGTDKGDIFLSENGADWTWVWQRPDAPIQSFLAGDSIILAASGWIADLGIWDCWGPACISPATLGRVLRSRDGGRSWADAGLPGVTALAHLSGSVVLAATLSGFYRSPDWGLTWQPITVNPGPGSTWTTARLRSFAVRQMASSGGDAYLVLADSTLHRLYQAAPGDTAYLIQAAVPGAFSVANAGDTLYACVRTALLRSRRRSPPAPLAWDTVGYGSMARIVPAPGRLFAIPRPARDVYSDGIRQSVDGGKTWTLATPPAEAGLTFGEYKGALYWGSRNGPVRRCEPGGQWAYASGGLNDMSVTNIALPKGSLLAVLDRQAPLYRGTGAAAAWTDLPVAASEFAARDSEAFFTSGGFWSSRQGGAPGTWNQLAATANAPVIVGDGWELILNRNSPRLRCASGSCEPLAYGDLPAQTSDSYYGSISNPFRAAAVAGNTVYIALDALYISTDRGSTFKFQAPERASALAAQGGRLYALLPGALDYDDDPRRTRLSVSGDGGLAWAPDDVSGIKDPGALRFLAARPGELFCAGDSGIYARPEGQPGWTPIGAGLPSPTITALAVGDGRLAVATKGGGIWVRALEPVATRVLPGEKARPGSQGAAGRTRPRFMVFRRGEGPWRRIDGRSLAEPRPAAPQSGPPR
jgi:hypothetical protein